MITVDSDTLGSPLGEPVLPGGTSEPVAVASGTSEPGAVASTLTGDPSIDGLIAGHQWDTFSLGYNFPSTASFYASTVAERSGFLAATDPMEAQIRAVLANYSDVCNLTFSELNPSSHDAALHMAMTVQADDLAGTGYFPDEAQHGNLWIDRDYAASNSNFALGTYDYNLLTHELGHVLGLKHPHDGEGKHGNSTKSPVAHDAHEFSVMSYHSYPEAPSGTSNGYGSYQTSLMMDDIAALQHMYGANFNTRAGPTTYSFDPNMGQMSVDGVGQGLPAANKIFLTIWDGGGTDTYDFSNYATNLKVYLSPGGSSVLSTNQLADLGNGRSAMGSVYNARLFKGDELEGDERSLIENARGGSGNDMIGGNAGHNELYGNDGKDSFFGEGGDDLLVGGNGSDVVRGGTEDDSLFGQAEDDTLLGEFGSDWLVGGEDRDILRGGDGSDTLNGSEGNDKLYGDLGNDLLHGGEGADRIEGGAGDDILYGATEDDRFVFQPGDGSDVIHDFTPGGDEDALAISSIASFADLLTATLDVGTDCIIQVDAFTSVTLVGVNKGQLTAADFYVPLLVGPIVDDPLVLA